MTRSLSNLIKSNFIYFNKADMKIIDSNIKTDSFTPTIYPKCGEEQIDESEFIEGINPNQIKKLIVPEEDFAKEKAEQMIAEAKKKADEIINQAIAKAEQSKAAIYEEAKLQGYEEGYSEGSAKIKELEIKLNNDILSHQAEYEQQISEIEPKMVELMISLIRKITGIVIEDKKDVILYLVKNTFKNTENCKEFVIKVSKEDYVTLINNKEEICSNLKDDVKVEIVEDLGLNQNQCMIETESSIIDCSLDVQYENLITNMRLLSYV